MVPDEDDECIHGLGPVSACVICNGRAEREGRNASTGRLFSAAFPGRCSACEEKIEPGDLIGPFERGGYGCQECWEKHR